MNFNRFKSHKDKPLTTQIVLKNKQIQQHVCLHKLQQRDARQPQSEDKHAASSDLEKCWSCHVHVRGNFPLRAFSHQSEHIRKNLCKFPELNARFPILVLFVPSLTSEDNRRFLMDSEFFRSWISSTICTSPSNTTDLCRTPLSKDENGEARVIQPESKPENSLFKTKITMRDVSLTS